MEAPIAHGEFLLQKTPGKGGWTYAKIPFKAEKGKSAFGWIKVKGNIDGLTISNYHLMPLDDKHLFFPVKAGIRKQTHKWQGDYVSIVIYLDNDPLRIPEEILACFKNEPKELLQRFYTLSPGRQKSYLDWINAAKREETKVNRIATMIGKLSKGEE
nr:YdeI/OmpD-associated family protein [Allomuricauda sp.]